MIYKFYKESSGRWYVDLPTWEGSKAELEMVAGADSMLEYMAEGEEFVQLILSEENFEGSDALNIIEECKGDIGGALYLMTFYKGIQLNLEMWLCDVTKFVFNKFPKIIYISKV